MDTFFINQQNCHSINKIAISTPKSTLAALVRHSAIHLLPPSQEEPHPPPIPCPGLSIPTHREGNWYLTSDLLPKPDKASLHANNVLSDQLHFSCNKMAIPHLHSDRTGRKTGKITADSHRILQSGLCTSQPVKYSGAIITKSQPVRADLPK